MKNRSNIHKYRRLAPFYDKLMGNGLFRKARKQAFSEISVNHGESILLVGVGTGEDFPFLPDDVKVTGIDLSEDMLKIAAGKTNGRDITLHQMNAEEMSFSNHKFNVVVLNLILSVVESPEEVLKRAIDCLDADGTILIFDKFVDSNTNPNVMRRLLNKLTSAIGTDINRDFFQMKGSLPIEITKAYKVLNGLYSIIIVRKK